MLITVKSQGSPLGGRALLSQLIYRCLADTFAHRIVILELEPRRVVGLKAIAETFLGYIDGIDRGVVASVLCLLREKGVRRLLIDGSNLGTLATIKSRYRDLEVSTFFHNCETRFFWGALKQQRTFRSLGVLIANYLAERRAIRYSDKTICLSERDSNVLLRLYRRGATHIWPMAMRDQLPKHYLVKETWAGEAYALFVGGNFYANRAGIAWFAEHVAPYINIKTYVVGQGSDLYREKLERFVNIKVIGAVKSLTPWYLGARFVVAPIFDGSGMKTKVAEALMHGKKIIGTPEAFSGYEQVSKKAGWICRTSKEFIAAVELAQNIVLLPFDPNLRSIYEELYSYEAAQRRLKTILMD